MARTKATSQKHRHERKHAAGLNGRGHSLRRGGVTNVYKRRTLRADEMTLFTVKYPNIVRVSTHTPTHSHTDTPTHIHTACTPTCVLLRINKLRINSEPGPVAFRADRRSRSAIAPRLGNDLNVVFETRHRQARSQMRGSWSLDPPPRNFYLSVTI